MKKKEYHAKVQEKKEEIKNDVLSHKVEPKKAEPNKVDVLQAGQKYFEAPDGTLIIGESGKQQLWHRKLNDGKGGWINPKR